MALKKLKIATRKSILAMVQTELVRDQLLKIDPSLAIELVPIVTEGDRKLEQALSNFGGKGVFIKALEAALLSGEADIAVHSLKDMPYKLPEGLALGAILPREDPRDAWLSEKYNSWQDLPDGAIVGTASLRRQAQIRKLCPQVNVKLLRGNVQTRLAKLQAGEYDGILLAAAGLHRLQLTNHIKQYFAADNFLSAVAQGAIAIETRADDQQIIDLLQSLHDADTACCVRAERAMNSALGGSCHSPIAGLAQIKDNQLQLEGLVATLDGKKVLRAKLNGNINQPESLGNKVAAQLIAAGGAEILAKVNA